MEIVKVLDGKEKAKLLFDVNARKVEFEEGEQRISQNLANACIGTNDHPHCVLQYSIGCLHN